MVSFEIELSLYNKETPEGEFEFEFDYDKFLDNYAVMLYDFLRQTYTARQVRHGVEIYLNSAELLHNDFMRDFENLPKVASEAIALVNDIFLADDELRDLRMRGLALFCKKYQ